MKKIILTLLILLGSSIYADDLRPIQGRSFFQPRSQATNAARELTLWHRYIHLPDNCFYGAVTGTVEYLHSARPNRIAEAFFGTDCLTISGSMIPNRGEQDILADYFGLSPEFISTVKIAPVIQNAVIPFNIFVGLNPLLCGLYFTVQLPFVWTKWHFQLDETVSCDAPLEPFPARYMDAAPVIPPVNSFKAAVAGNVTFGQMQDPLQFGIISPCPLTETGLAQINFVLGWDFILTDYDHVGLQLRAVAPTGTRPDSVFLFEPIVGNGHHWELGVGVSAHTLLWEKDGCQALELWGQLNMMHQFGTRQCRSIDFCENGPLSRYVLLKEFNEAGNYTGSLTPAINQTTLPVTVSVDFMMDLVIMFAYLHQDWTFDIGYNAWLRSREKIALESCLPENKFGIKGIQNATTLANDLSNSTQSCATIHGNEFTDQFLLVDVDSPVFENTDSLNLRSAGSPFVFTHKLFGAFGHQWPHEVITPFLGLGFEIEFEGVNTRNNFEPHNNTLSQWGLFTKAGLSF